MAGVLAAILALHCAQAIGKPLPLDGLVLGPIQAHLLYKSSGRFSADILAPDSQFAAWNIVIGSGSADGPVDDVLVLVPVLNGPGGRDGEVYADVPVVVRVRGEKGKIIAERRFESVFADGAGHEFKALWLPDAGCAGSLTFEAVMGKQRRSAEFTFACGD